MEQSDEITLSLPSDAAYLPVVRVAAAVIADRAGLSHLDIEDLRLALDELVHHVLADRTGGLELTLRYDAGSVTVDGRRTDLRTADEPPLSPVLGEAVDAAVDRWTLHEQGPGSFHVEKRRGAAV